MLDKPPQPALYHFLFPLPFGYPVRVGFGAFGQVFQRGYNAFQFLQISGVGWQGGVCVHQCGASESPGTCGGPRGEAFGNIG